MPDGKGGYLVTEADGTQHLPTKKNGTLDRGLCGAAWAALHGGFRGEKYDGPNKADALKKLTTIHKAQGWPLPTAKMSADFALTDPVSFDDGMVVRRGKIFEVGEYPDKNYSMTAAELAAAAAAFTPCGLDLEHQSTVLDGNLGELRSVEVSPDGSTLYGNVALPPWLDGLLEGTGRKVSATWNRTTKMLEGLALVNHPRIADAALLSAFAAASPHTTSDGQRVVQAVHDMTARSGAVCTTSNPNGTQQYSSSYFVSAGEGKTIQALHDSACAGGAKCTAMEAKTSAYSVVEALFVGARHTKADLADMQKIHDLSTGQGATCAPATMGGNAPKGRPTMANKFGSWFGLGRDAREMARDAGADLPPEEHFSVVADEVQDERAQARAEETAKFEKDKADAAKMKADAETIMFQAQAKEYAVDAKAFFNELLAAGKALPALKDKIEAAYVQAAADDLAHGKASFTQGTGSRVEQLKAMWEAVPGHILFHESKPGTFSLLAGGASGEDDPAAAKARQEKIKALPAYRGVASKQA